MGKRISGIIILLIVIAAGLFFFLKTNPGNTTTEINPAQITETEQPAEIPTPTSTPVPDWAPPLNRAGERVTKKTFGMYISPANSPVQPERFSGWHTGTDFETFPEEKNTAVPVAAVCKGKLLVKEYASGYGGVAVQACELNGQAITVIYGHLKPAGIAAAVGQNLNPGDLLGILGEGFSTETDGERKHLHLGFHKGTAVNIRGYVDSLTEVYNWLDPCIYVCNAK